jgi:hypothetical protein
MCCFSPVSSPLSWIGRLLGAGRVRVSKTSIFARLDGDTQVLAYAMTMSAPSEVAMILPVPTPPGADEDALTFIDLQGYAHLFTELASLFEVQAKATMTLGALPARAGRTRTLKVHKVGSFVASFVPSRADFGRLEARFRLPDAVWDAVPDARDFGFAVFQLEAGAQQLHPMAFRFRTRDPRRLFFPTLHVHDGRVHARAKFDHALYFQHPKLVEPRQSSVLPDFLDDAQIGFGTARTDYNGVVVQSQPILRRMVRGRRPNRDTYVEVGA